MNHCLAQTIYLARNGDAEGWMNILFVVILAVFYAVGGIVKAKSNKSEQEDEDRQPAPKPRFKPTQQTAHRQPQRPVARTAAQQAPIPPARIKAQSREPQLVQPTEFLQDGKLSHLQFDTEKSQKSFTKPLKELEVGQALTQPRKIQPRTIIVEEPLVRFDNSDELKKAILHYEILGTPLALRKPTEF